MRAALAFLAIVASVSGCATDHSAACASLFDAQNDRNERCFAAPSMTTSERADFIAFCNDFGAATGVANFDSELSQCTNDVASLPCPVSGGGGGIVDYPHITCPFIGTRPLGARCNADAQCASGLCSQEGIECGGTCAQNVPCVTSCGSSTICIDGACHPFANLGDACGTVDAPTPCTPDIASCDASSHTCVPLPTLNEACSSSCAAGYVCSAGTCTTPVGVGGACPIGDECLPSLDCDSSHICRSPTSVGVGEACGPTTDGFAVCASGLACVQDGATSSWNCIALHQRGEACIAPTAPTQLDDWMIRAGCDVGLICVGGVCDLPSLSCN